MNYSSLRRPLLLGLLALPAAPVVAQNPSANGAAFVRDSLASYVQRGLKLWNIPGLAVTVVKDGQVVVSQGFGTKEAGKAAPVDGNTLFLIASNSKLFTGTAISQLQEEGKLKLDDPVRKYLPDFRLYDSTSTRLVSVRDILSHRLGTKTFQGDFTFWDSNLSRADIIRRVRLLKPTQPFRQNYGYCNAGFLAAGEIIPVVNSGQTWESWVQQRLLTPLGMSNTYPLTTGAAQRPNVALPYTNAFGPLTRVPFDEVDNFGPAASMVSNVNDLGHWLRFQLDSGKYQGQRVLPWATLRRTREGNTLSGTSKSPIFPSHFRTYGLGVFAADYNGRQIYWHTGGANGFVTNVCFVPEESLGLAVLTNQDNQSFFEALRYQLLDAYLGVPYVDRSRQLYKLGQPGRDETARDIAAQATRVAKKNKLPRKLAAYAGSYEHPLYGPITVAAQGKQQLLIRFSHHPKLIATLDYMDGEQFRCTYSNAAYGIFPAIFAVENGAVKTLEIRVNDGLEQDPYLFSRQ
ncbi:serine hydrolase [Hymenobacter sp. ASUV-10]|uniref:Serine hydrolase n=1 Tax=Hymenobacter aranciens TaxID=3063996 RepID=A0ABT9BH35_9BACT|nr:serine hydrolase [Hymenobacter sp. ASUV-10]MDO7877105.1 serine hydrolase [Hymenobacter sp. ASUV-10]